MYGLIYKVTNKENGKVYIGQTTRSLEERKYYHYYRAEHEPEVTHTHFINALRKYDKDCFSWEIIDTADSQEELNEKEIGYIQKYDSIMYGYNTQAGGQDQKTDKFALACGAREFYAYRVNGDFIGTFINATEFSRQYGCQHIADLLNNKYTSCNGIIAIPTDIFTEEILKKKIAKAKNTFRPFIAIDLKTKEEFGPFTVMKECQDFLGLKSNHIGEILRGQRNSQGGYTFKFIDNI